MKVVVSAAGRFHAFHLARQLAQRGALERFYTASWLKGDARNISSSRVTSNYVLQYGEWIYEKARLNRFFKPSDYYVFKDNYFDRWVARKLAGKIDIFTVWAHYGLASIPRAKKLGARVVLECGSMHILEQEKILIEEYERWGLSVPPLNPQNREKVLQEYRVTDYLVIPSAHVEKSFIKHGVPGNKLIKIPYGTDLSRFKPKMRLEKKKFRVLFVGTINLNKGIPYLLDGWKSARLPLNDAELVLVGNIQSDIKMSYLKNYQQPENVIFAGTLPQHELAEMYKTADVLVLPSLQEGIAMVQVEAMASGVPVIATPHSGAEDLFADGVAGFIVPTRSVTALAEKIVWGYEHREELFVMGQHAAKQAQAYSWDAYGQRVFQAYKKMLEG